MTSLRLFTDNRARDLFVWAFIDVALLTLSTRHRNGSCRSTVAERSSRRGGIGEGEKRRCRRWCAERGPGVRGYPLLLLLDPPYSDYESRGDAKSLVVFVQLRHSRPGESELSEEAHDSSLCGEHTTELLT